MKKLLTLLCLCVVTISVSAQKSDYKPCDECFGYQAYGTYKPQTTAERQYQQVSANGLNYENGYHPRHEFGNRILRIAIGLVSFAVIVAILPRHDTPYIQ